MARKIRVGDKVQGFLKPTVKGVVVDILPIPNADLMVDATGSSSNYMCVVSLESTGELFPIRMSEVFIHEY